MEYRRFGKTEEQISVITLGGMRFKQGWNLPRNHLPRESIDNCIDITRQALDLGINHFETAHGYMKSEGLYGTAFRELGTPRNKFKMMTKGAPKTADDTRALVEEQLKTLKMDYFDFYGWHGINNEELLNIAIKKNGPVETLLKMREEGIIRHVGFSTHGPLDVIMKALQTGLFSFVNLHFYFFFQRNLPAVELAKAMDIGVFIISPNEKGGTLWNPSKKLQTLCAPLTPIQFNGRYCLSYPQVTTLSLGIHHPDHFDQNLKILGGDIYFSPEQKEIEQRVRFPLQNFSSECTYCSECLPCPEDINIPEILRFRNLLQAYEMKDYGKFRYNMLEGKGHWFPGHFAFACTECGECLPKCPEKLDIPRLLFETHDQLFDRKAYLKNKVMDFLKKIYIFLFRR
jgi:uncharacterized protein